MFPDLPSGLAGIQTNSPPEGKENPEAVSVKSQAPDRMHDQIIAYSVRGAGLAPVGQMIELSPAPPNKIPL